MFFVRYAITRPMTMPPANEANRLPTRMPHPLSAIVMPK